MYNLPLIEECYKKFVKDLQVLIPEGIYSINLELLHRFNLLHFQFLRDYKNPISSRYFHLIEYPEKITMINDEFIVWIIPKNLDQIPLTYALIALNSKDKEPQLEVAFIASGVYNSSRLVLKVLEKFLIEIEDTEQTLSKFHDP